MLQFILFGHSPRERRVSSLLQHPLMAARGTSVKATRGIRKSYKRGKKDQRIISSPPRPKLVILSHHPIKAKQPRTETPLTTLPWPPNEFLVRKRKRDRGENTYISCRCIGVLFRLILCFPVWVTEFDQLLLFTSKDRTFTQRKSQFFQILVLDMYPEQKCLRKTSFSLKLNRQKVLPGTRCTDFMSKHATEGGNLRQRHALCTPHSFFRFCPI